MTNRLLESTLDGEIIDHLGCDKHDPAGRGTGSLCHGTRSKTVLTDVGPVQVDVPMTGTQALSRRWSRSGRNV
ncbi:hypothetical protein ACXIZN_25360 [Amycolatopsis sp. TRM77291]